MTWIEKEIARKRERERGREGEKIVIEVIEIFQFIPILACIHMTNQSIDCVQKLFRPVLVCAVLEFCNTTLQAVSIFLSLYHFMDFFYCILCLQREVDRLYHLKMVILGTYPPPLNK